MNTGSCERVVLCDRVYKTKDSYTLYEGLTKPIRWIVNHNILYRSRKLLFRESDSRN